MYFNLLVDAQTFLDRNEDSFVAGTDGGARDAQVDGQKFSESWRWRWAVDRTRVSQSVSRTHLEGALGADACLSSGSTL